MSRGPLEVLRDAKRALDSHDQYRLGTEVCIAIAQVEALAHEARAVLEHVESDRISRIGGQCTLCHTYRMKLHSALDPFTPGQDSEGGGNG